LPLRETGKNYGSNQFLNWLQQYTTGILRFDLSSPFLPNIAKEQIPNRVSALLYLGAYFDRIPGHGVHLYFMQTEANTDGHH
jgi:hypothetical protein